MPSSEKRRILIRRTPSGIELETESDAEQFDSAYSDIEELWAQLTRLELEFRPVRTLIEIERECQPYWTEKDSRNVLSNDVRTASYRVGLSVLNGRNEGKPIGLIAGETKLTPQLVRYHLTEATFSSEWYEQDEERKWRLTNKGIDRIINEILPYLKGRHGNMLCKVLTWLDKKLFQDNLDDWLSGKKKGKVEQTDFFEFAIGLLLSTIGFSVYQVGMYNERFDLVAYSDDEAIILLCECTGGAVRKKSSSLNLALEELEAAVPDARIEGVVFTTSKISSTDRKDLRTDNVRVFDSTQIKELAKLAETDRNPELLFDIIRKKEKV